MTASFAMAHEIQENEPHPSVAEAFDMLEHHRRLIDAAIAADAGRADLWRRLTVAPEYRCAPYDRE